MDKVIESWAFLESILPGEVPSMKDKIKGYMFKDRQDRKRVNPIIVSQSLWETIRSADVKKYALSFNYYMDCYEQDQLVQLFRTYFNSDDEIVNRNFKRCYSFAFKVNELGEYVEDSLFIPHVQLIIHDIQTKQSIQYETFIERYHEARNRVAEAAGSIFSDGVQPAGIQRLREVFHDYFGSLSKETTSAYVEINIENKRYPQETPQFNSFYLEDLQLIKRKGPNETLKQFIGGKPLELDINENEQAIQQMLAPEKLPLGRWPSPIGHRLSLMQQVAVNQILNSNEKICSVNGPPGTGKTTLLKDVFAQVVVERAIEMATYQDPAEAFKKAGQLKIDQYHFNMYELDEKVAKFSMVVASSNNGAVENITKDLPKFDAVVRDSKEPSEEECREELARTGADLHYRHKCELKYGEEAQKLDLFADLSSAVIQSDHTWGLFSAALGRSSNITSVSMTLNGKVKKGDESTLHPFVEQLEKPLPPDAWKEAIKEFNELRQSVEKKREELQQYAHLMLQAEQLIVSERQAADTLEKTKAEQQQIKLSMEKNDKQRQLVNEQLDNLPAPTLWEKCLQLFSKKRNEEEEKIRKELHLLIEEQKRLTGSSHDGITKIEQLKKEVQQLQYRLAELNKLRETYSRQQLVLPTEDFWSKEMYEERQKSVLWQTDELNFERGLLFLKAMNVHKIFLMMNAKPIKGALSVLSNRQNINLNIDENKKYVANMWKVLHLIFPVISTTFASFSSMYRGIEEDFIGYLFVDEAGQASPQQAAGALWRSRRAIIVGDPIQIEPVVPIDETILYDVRCAFDVSEAYIGTTASVQTLADFANPIGTCKGKKEERQRIGIPLWVHRRCVEPMFSIANEIAYNNKMVLPIKKIGRSQWYDCSGKAVQSQYVEEQGDFIAGKIRSHFAELEEGESAPSVFVITPFTAVKEGLKNLLKQQLKAEIPGIEKWAERAVGTVHTFQGKEADIVYFVTGTDAQTDGAAEWTCSKPNLINVAVTRAKKEFYVVGDLKRFQSKDYYKVINRRFDEFKSAD